MQAVTASLAARTRDSRGTPRRPLGVAASLTPARPRPIATRGWSAGASPASCSASPTTERAAATAAAKSTWMLAEAPSASASAAALAVPHPHAAPRRAAVDADEHARRFTHARFCSGRRRVANRTAARATRFSESMRPLACNIFAAMASRRPPGAGVPPSWSERSGPRPRPPLRRELPRSSQI